MTVTKRWNVKGNLHNKMHDIEEAAQLADRVLVLSKRPATVCYELNIKAVHPRGVGNDEVVEAMRQILRELGLNNSETAE